MTERPPPPPDPPEWSSHIEGRRPKWKYHKKRGQAMIAVIQKRRGSVWRYDHDKKDWELHIELDPNWWACDICNKTSGGLYIYYKDYWINSGESLASLELVQNPLVEKRCWRDRKVQIDTVNSRLKRPEDMLDIIAKG